MTGKITAICVMLFLFAITATSLSYKTGRKDGVYDHREFLSRLANRPFNR
jgi:hypothetical protein